MTPAEIQYYISVLDLTSLNESDTPETISGLCYKASTIYGHVAAVCIYPKFVSLAWQILMQTSIKIATVVNFPHGKSTLNEIEKEIQHAIFHGTAEIDLVIPYYLYEKNARTSVCEFIRYCKFLCGNKVILKTILETGALNQAQIHAASEDAIESGADFLKTSTGKTPVGATLEAAEIMLKSIKQSGRSVGFKASGGIRTIAQAISYRQLVEKILGQKAATPERFRLGASSLLDNLLEH